MLPLMLVALLMCPCPDITRALITSSLQCFKVVAKKLSRKTTFPDFLLSSLCRDQKDQRYVLRLVIECYEWSEFLRFVWFFIYSEGLQEQRNKGFKADSAAHRLVCVLELSWHLSPHQGLICQWHTSFSTLLSESLIWPPRAWKYIRFESQLLLNESMHGKAKVAFPSWESNTIPQTSSCCCWDTTAIPVNNCRNCH